MHAAHPRTIAKKKKKERRLKSWQRVIHASSHPSRLLVLSVAGLFHLFVSLTRRRHCVRHAAGTNGRRAFPPCQVFHLKRLRAISGEDAKVLGLARKLTAVQSPLTGADRTFSSGFAATFVRQEKNKQAAGTTGSDSRSFVQLPVERLRRSGAHLQLNEP